MNEPDQPPTPDRLTALLEEGDHQETVACLDRLGAADAETRKRTLRAVRDVAEEPPRAFDGLDGPLSAFLTDEDRAVRLTTAKLFVTLAQSEPVAVLPAVDALADRLADDEDSTRARPATDGWLGDANSCASLLLGVSLVEVLHEAESPDETRLVRLLCCIDSVSNSAFDKYSTTSNRRDAFINENTLSEYSAIALIPSAVPTPTPTPSVTPNQTPARTVMASFASGWRSFGGSQSITSRNILTSSH